MTSHRTQLFVATAIAAVSFAFPAGAALAVASQPSASAGGTAPSVRADSGRVEPVTLWRGEGVACPAGSVRPAVLGRGAVVGGRDGCFRLSRRIMVIDRPRAVQVVPDHDGAGWEVEVTFDGGQRREFTRVTGAAVGHEVALLDGDRLITAPTVQGPISAPVLEIPGLTLTEAQHLARDLKNS